ncbi:MAG: polyphenol oxidase family protein [Thermoanaerobaculia bacterium]|nr:polyphenol oxidase family protein [Thermoanaerobaculia bacterium]
MDGLERIVTPPEVRGGVFVWRFAAAGAEVRFLGRGAPGRSPGELATVLPAGVEPAWLEQVHSARLRLAAPGCCGAGDALVARREKLAAVVATADCVPVAIAAGDRVLAVHAGWRGLVAGILASALRELPATAGAVAWIGPAIGPCCYEVGDAVADAVCAVAGDDVRSTGASGRPHLDLAAAVTAQLAAAGLSRVVRLDHCTRCRADWLWSHRRDGAAAGRNLTLVWRRAPDDRGAAPLRAR